MRRKILVGSSVFFDGIEGFKPIKNAYAEYCAKRNIKGGK